MSKRTDPSTDAPPSDIPPPDAVEDDRADKDPRVTRWLDRLAASRHKDALLFGASMAETLIVPIPIELILVPYMLAAQRRRRWVIAAVALAGCLTAAGLGYAFAWAFMDGPGRWLIDAMGWTEAWRNFQDTFARQGFWAIVAVGVTPVPFQVAILTAGATGYSIPLFVLAAALARGLRYFGLALLVDLFGDQAIRLWSRHKITVGVLAAAVVATLWLGSSLPWPGGDGG